LAVSAAGPAVLSMPSHNLLCLPQHGGDAGRPYISTCQSTGALPCHTMGTGSRVGPVADSCAPEGGGSVSAAGAAAAGVPRVHSLVYKASCLMRWSSQSTSTPQPAACFVLLTEQGMGARRTPIVRQRCSCCIGESMSGAPLLVVVQPSACGLQGVQEAQNSHGAHACTGGPSACCCAACGSRGGMQALLHMMTSDQGPSASATQLH
jgi:hypothetical protein